MFEVHYWPNVGRILIIHIPDGTSHGPILTELTVTGVSGPADNDGSVFACALALADAGTPHGALAEHIGNNVHYIRDDSGRYDWSVKK